MDIIMFISHIGGARSCAGAALRLLCLCLLAGAAIGQNSSSSELGREVGSALTLQYAPDGNWTAGSLLQLFTAIQRSAASGHACRGDHCPATHRCLTPEELLSPASDGGDTSLESLCPLVLHQSQAPRCMETITHYVQTQKQAEGRSKPTPVEVWGYGLLFVTVISLSSIFAVLLLPVLGRSCFERLMPGLIGLAVGSLASSALFHLIPQAFELVTEGAGHGYLNTSLCVLCGSWFFFMLERMMKIYVDFKKRRSGAKSGALSDALAGSPSSDSDLRTEVCRNGGSGSVTGSVSSEQPAGCAAISLAADVEAIRQTHQEPVRAMFGQVEQKPHSRHHHDHEIQFQGGEGGSTIAVVAWMVIFGDGFHNFLDGLSIGAAFSENTLTGISISLAVICEELPHELGDFAVLLDAGMTVRQAVLYNFLSACTCYLGLVVGIVIGDFTESTTFVFALAAGMFLYISLVDMVPEMNEAAEKASAVSVPAGLKVLLLQNVGIFVGCFSLFSLAYFQDSISLG